MSQYVKKFEASDISGKVLLCANTEMLSGLGVSNPLHQVKIMQLFPRKLQNTSAKYSRDHLNRFLCEQKLEMYAAKLEQHGIDGDMILNVNGNLMKSALKEAGVTKSVHSTKIHSRYPKYCKYCI